MVNKFIYAGIDVLCLPYIEKRHVRIMYPAADLDEGEVRYEIQ